MYYDFNYFITFVPIYYYYIKFYICRKRNKFVNIRYIHGRRNIKWELVLNSAICRLSKFFIGNHSRKMIQGLKVVGP